MTAPTYFRGRRWISHCEDMALVGFVGHYADEPCLICAEAAKRPQQSYYTVTKVEKLGEGGARVTLNGN